MAILGSATFDQDQTFIEIIRLIVVGPWRIPLAALANVNGEALG